MSTFIVYIHYAFVGWQEEEGTIYWKGNQVPVKDRDLVFTATWQSYSYKLTVIHNYNKKGSATPDTVKDEKLMLYGSPFNASKEDKDGYTHTKVKVDGVSWANDKAEAVTGNMPARDVTITFTYDPSPVYPVIYLPGTEESVDWIPVDSEEYAAGIEVTVSNMIPKRTGYQFMGWELKNNLQYKTRARAGIFAAPQNIYQGNDKVNMVVGGLTFEAVWQANNSRLQVIHNYYGRDGEITFTDRSGTEDLAFGSSINASKVDRENYVYTGVVVNGIDWANGKAETVTGVMPGEKVTITFTYREDRIGTTDPAKPDGIPDEYQVLVYYKAINGTVSLAQAVVTLYDDQNQPSATGFGRMTENQIAKGTANSGYRQNSESWDIVPATSLEIRESITFTVSYESSTGGNTDGGDPGTGGNRPGSNTPDNGVGPGYPDLNELLPEDVPLANLPTLPTNSGTTLFIGDGEVPLANLPKTDDKAAEKAQLGLLFSGLLMGLYVAMKKQDVRK